jgi:hypothetical protein
MRSPTHMASGYFEALRWHLLHALVKHGLPDSSRLHWNQGPERATFARRSVLLPRPEQASQCWEELVL